MRRSLTVNGATDCATVGMTGAAVSAEARARASRRREKGRVIITSGWGRSAPAKRTPGRAGCLEAALGQVGRLAEHVATSAHQQVRDVVVETQTHQGGDQTQADVLASGHPALPDRAALSQLDQGIPQVSAVQD